MASANLRLLFVFVVVSMLTIPRPVESGSGTSSECGCLPDKFQGRMRVSDLGSSNAEGLARLALIGQLYNDPAWVNDLEILFKVDLLNGLVILESSPSNGHQDRHQSHGNDRLRQWAVVIDIGNLLSSSSLPPSEKLALIYFIDKESNQVWNVDIGGRNHRHSLNRCPLHQSAWQTHQIDGLDLLYLLDGQGQDDSFLPILMAMSSKSCLPTLLSDVARVAILVEHAEELQTFERSLLMYEAMILRQYLQQGNQGNLDPNSNSGMNDQKTGVVLLIMRWLLKTEDKNPVVTPKACCLPTKWQGSVTKTTSYRYNVMDQKSGAQTMVMDKVYVDRGQQSVAGSFYQMVDNIPSDNYTFLAFYDGEVSQSFLIYMFDKSSNFCMAANITGIQQPTSRSCMSQDVATYIGQINFGMQMSLDGWKKSFSVPEDGYTATVKDYVAMVDGQYTVSQGKRWPTCMPVIQITDWETPLESVSALAMVYDTELGVPDDAFTMPPSCVGVDMMTMSDSEVNGAFQPVMTMFNSL